MEKKISGLYIALIAVLVLSCGACSQKPLIPLPEETPQDVYPIDALPKGAGGELFAGVLSNIENGDYGNIHSLVIIKDDTLVLEKYFRGWTRHMLHPCFSVTKSVTSALIGIALEKGYIQGVNENLLGFFPDYTDIKNLDERKQAITLEHVLTMTSGLEWNESPGPLFNLVRNHHVGNDIAKMALSEDWIHYVLDRPMEYEPGTSDFTYSSGSAHLLSGVIKNRTGITAEDFAAEHLFSKLGITVWQWSQDPQGFSNTGWGLSLHPVNMAMFGHLFLHNGQRGEEHIVPEPWVTASTAKQVVIDYHAGTATKALFDYGYLWWRFDDGYFQDNKRGPVPPKVNDIFYADGLAGQLIFVVPHLNLVITTTAENFSGSAKSLDLFFDCLAIINGT